MKMRFTLTLDVPDDEGIRNRYFLLLDRMSLAVNEVGVDSWNRRAIVISTLENALVESQRTPEYQETIDNQKRITIEDSELAETVEGFLLRAALKVKGDSNENNT